MSPAARGPYFKPGVVLTAKFIGCLLIGALIANVGLCWARDRHEARTARLKLCAVELQLLEARSPFVATYLKPADPCLAVAVVRAGR